jgi:phosphoribosylglycinamide formyltransferase
MINVVEVAASSKRRVQQQLLDHSQQRSQHAQAVAAQAPGSEPSTSSSSPKKRLAVFVSGGGSNFRAIQAAILSGEIHGEVVAVVSNAPACGGFDFARQHGIPVFTYPGPKGAPCEGLTDEQLVATLVEELDVDYVILAGYLKLIPPALVRAFKRSILNIHPGLLPSFGGKGYYGAKVHAAVIASGARFSGPTIHFVDEEYDTGPILAQAAVPVYPTDTPAQLAARVLQQVKGEWVEGRLRM